MISQMRLLELQAHIEAGTEHAFYLWSEWQHKRQEVLALDCGECQICKTRHKRYRRAVIVHHVKHLKRRPDLALSIWDGEERQLLSVCRACHEDLHPERLYKPPVEKPQLTVERWD